MTELTADAAVRGLSASARDWSKTVAYAAGGLIVLVALAALFAPFIAPDDPNAVNIADVFAGPSRAHLLGTDAVGRDMLSRLLYGARPALLGPTLAVLIATTISAVAALVGAWFGGWVDRLLSRVGDVLFAFPGILLAMLAAAVLGASFATSIAAVGIAEVPYVARIVRTEAWRQRGRPYVEASLVQGFSRTAVISKHLLPNVLPTIFTQMTLSFGYVMMSLASVSFLGLGIQPPAADWGSMVSEGRSSLIGGHPQESLYAGACIVVIVVAFTLFGDYIVRRVEARR
jgi:peptide/nickel transport system permease protein